ncbi:M1 family metallopeptidase [Flavobacterium sp. H122]|uniref:M1 family metallopeptidase n=1 Tax=Flavobacterium sp. H122 TaxID=2529860 RepID=UPI0010AA18FD|nr:M1 family metallopeptidase [Flavobacterium sp. H122]
MRYFFLLFSVIAFGQQLEKVDFTNMNAHVNLYPSEKLINGNVQYDFEVKSKIDTIKIDAKSMTITDVSINGKVVNFKNNGKTLNLFEGYKVGKNQITFLYEAKPRQALYFVGWEANSGSEQIWTQGQGKYTSHWLPSFDDVNEKVIFNLSVSFNPFYQVISNGKLINTSMNEKGSAKVWKYEMQKPMSSYLVMLAIGRFDFKTLYSKSKIPLELYYKPEDASKFEWTYKYSKQIFDFLEKETGFKYPWEIYKQVPVHDFLYAGMENTTATLFAQDYVADEIGFNDQSYINVNAHELAHHWFGDLITAKEGKHHWLQEGFATYYALLAEKHLFGDTHFQYELLKNAEEIQKASKYDTIPILNEKASSLTFYKKGAWALHYLRESIGAEKFRKAVKTYLKKYQFKTVDTDCFLAEIKKVSPKFNTENFKNEWLEAKTSDTQKAIAMMSKNKVMSQYFELQKLQNQSFESKKGLFSTILKSNKYYILSQEIIYQLIDVPFEQKRELLQLAIKSNDLKIRQAIAESTRKIPVEFKTEYESLLNDNSYVTKEIVFQQLCDQFPEERAKYLTATESIIGNNDKSFRTIWLLYACLDKDFKPEEKPKFYNELINYTSTQYDATVRKNALEMLLQLNPTDERVLTSLVNATTHHKWQFVAFAKNTIRGMLKKEKFKKVFTELLPKLKEREQNFLKGEIK